MDLIDKLAIPPVNYFKDMHRDKKLDRFVNSYVEITFFDETKEQGIIKYANDRYVLITKAHDIYFRKSHAKKIQLKEH